MKFVQASDIHIGECRSLPGYLERHRGILNSITSQALQNGCPLVIAGDIFHAKNTTPDEALVAFEWFSSIESHQIPTVVIPGNHDHLFGQRTQLDPFLHVPYKHIRVFGWEPGVWEYGDAGFICMGWQDYSTEGIEETVKSMIPKIENKKYKVVVFHECLVGSKFDNGHVIYKGSKIPTIPEVTYWAVGDIHARQGTNVPNGHYAGAPAMFKFNDVENKGVLLVDLENPNEPEFIEIHSKKLKVVTKLEEIQDDSYYSVQGNLDTILKANLDERVHQTRRVEKLEPIGQEEFGLTDGLPEFLAEKGIEAPMQQKAVEWVKTEFRLE